MTWHGPRRYILCYDIADAQRLSRVHRRVKADGVLLQRSLYDYHFDQNRLQRLVHDLRQLIDEHCDDVRIYGPRHDAPIARIGVSHLPDGVQLFNNAK